MPNLLSIYTALQEGELTHDQAAAAFGRTPSDLKGVMTRYGHTLPLLLSTMDAIHRGDISREQAAQTLGVSVRAVNKQMLSWKVTRPIGKNAIVEVTAAIKWKVQNKFACDFIAGRLNLEQASEAAGVSTRQMRRIVSELLEKHLGMVYVDLQRLTMHRAQAVAREIEKAEALDEATRRLADDIGARKTTVALVGASTLASKRASKPRKTVSAGK